MSGGAAEMKCYVVIFMVGERTWAAGAGAGAGTGAGVGFELPIWRTREAVLAHEIQVATTVADHVRGDGCCKDRRHHGRRNA